MYIEHISSSSSSSSSSVVLLIGGVVTKIKISVTDNRLNHVFMVFIEISKGAEETNNWSTYATLTLQVTQSNQTSHVQEEWQKIVHRQQKIRATVDKAV